MRLLAAELRKVWGGRVVLICLGILFALNLFLIWNAARPAAGALPAAAFRTMDGELSGMTMDEKRAFINEEYARAEALNKIESALITEAWGWHDENPRITYANLFGRYGALYESGDYLRYGATLEEEYRFLYQIKAEFDVVDHYEGFLDEIESKATQLSGISIFATENADSFEEQNISATAAAYQGMRGISISYAPQRGIMAATAFRFTDLVTLFAMLLLASALVRQERDSGLLGLVRATPRGRGATAAAKLGALAASLLIVLALLYGGNLLLCHMLYGLGDLSRSVQSVPGLMRSTLRISVGGYLGAYLLAKWAAAFVIGVWVMLAALVAKRPLSGWLGALLLPAASLLLRQAVPAAGHFNVLKYASLASLITTNELLGGHRSLYWFGSPVALTTVEACAAILYAALFITAFCLVFTKAQLLPAGQGARRFALPSLRLPRRKKAGSTTILWQEAHKLFVLNGAGLILLLLIAWGIFQGASSQSYFGPDDIYTRRYMSTLAGPITNEKLAWMETEKARFTPLLQLRAKYAKGEIGESEYYRSMSNYYGLQEEMDIFARIISRYNELRKLPGAQFVYDAGYPRFFGLSGNASLQDTILAALACALCFSGLFAMEKSTGMARILGATPLGRGATAKAKLRLAGISAAGIALALALPHWWQLLRDYGFSAPFAPLYSLPQYPTTPRFATILGLAIAALVARLVACCAMAAVTLVLSQRIGSTLPTLFCSCVLFGLPPLLSLAGLPALRWAGVYPLFHFPAMMQNTAGAIAAWLLLIAWAAVALACAAWLRGSFATAPLPRALRRRV